MTPDVWDQRNVTLMEKSFREQQLPALRQTMLALIKFGPECAAPKPTYIQIMGAHPQNVIWDLQMAILGLETSAESDYQKNRIGALDTKGLSRPAFENYLASIHRKFYSDLAIAIETSCVELVKSRGASSPSGTNFMDYVEAALKSVSMTDDQKKRWRKYFDAVRVLRNKSAHYNTSLNDREQELLRSAGQGQHIGADGKVRTTVSNYAPFIEKSLEFLGSE
jgi:hypothetical protein